MEVNGINWNVISPCIWKRGDWRLERNVGPHGAVWWRLVLGDEEVTNFEDSTAEGCVVQARACFENYAGLL